MGRDFDVCFFGLLDKLDIFILIKSFKFLFFVDNVYKVLLEIFGQQFRIVEIFWRVDEWRK